MPLPVTEYTGTILLPNANVAIAARELATGVVGRIASAMAATVNIAYLTTSEKHNQRLIIVNRGNQADRYH